jgi:hypothetical protein
LASLILGIFFLKQADCSLSLSIDFTNIFIKASFMCSGGIYKLLIYPLKPDVPLSSDLLLFLNGVAVFFYSLPILNLSPRYKALAAWAVALSRHEERLVMQRVY